MTRKEILEAAKNAVCGERQESYGAPEDNFARIARLWSVYLGVNVTPGGVADMMILLKVARNASGVYTSDNWVDIAGYAACGGEIGPVRSCSASQEQREEETSQ